MTTNTEICSAETSCIVPDSIDFYVNEMMNGMVICPHDLIYHIGTNPRIYFVHFLVNDQWIEVLRRVMEMFAISRNIPDYQIEAFVETLFVFDTFCLLNQTSPLSVEECNCMIDLYTRHLHSDCVIVSLLLRILKDISKSIFFHHEIFERTSHLLVMLTKQCVKKKSFWFPYLIWTWKKIIYFHKTQEFIAIFDNDPEFAIDFLEILKLKLHQNVISRDIRIKLIVSNYFLSYFDASLEHYSVCFEIFYKVCLDRPEICNTIAKYWPFVILNDKIQSIRVCTEEIENMSKVIVKSARKF
jgi:hypothetical protein